MPSDPIKNPDAWVTTSDIGILWIVTNAISWCIGLAVGIIVELRLELFVSAWNDALWGISDLFGNLVSAVILGLAIGFGQALILKRSKRTTKSHWTLSTLLGFVIATFLIIVSGSHTFYPADCTICLGGIELPSRLVNLWPWNSVGGQRFTFGDLITSSIIGLATGASQYYFHKKQEFLTAGWVVWSTVSFVLAHIGAGIISIFATDVFIVGMTEGVLYGLLTVRPIKRQLKEYAETTQETQAEAA